MRFANKVPWTLFAMPYDPVRLGRRLRRRAGWRGDGTVIAILMLFAIFLGMIVFPLGGFLAILEADRQMRQTEAVNKVTQEIHEQAMVYLEEVLRERIGGHFQSQLEMIAPDDLRRGRLNIFDDPTARQTFFSRGFVVPHLTTWLGEEQENNMDPRLNRILDYLRSLKGASVLLIQYAGEDTGSTRPTYLLHCEVHVLSETPTVLPDDQVKQVRVAQFQMSFSPSLLPGGATPQNRLYLPGIVLYPHYE